MNKIHITLCKSAGLWKAVMILMMSICSLSYAMAGDIQSQVIFLKGSEGRIVPNAKLSLTESNWSSTNTDVRNRIEASYSIRNIVTLKLNDSLSGIISNDSVSVSVLVKIVRTYFSGAKDSTLQTLTLHYGSKVVKYSENANFVFNNAVQVDVTVLAISSNAPSSYNVARDLVLENEMIAQPQFKFFCATDSIGSVWKSDTTVATQGELTVSWFPVVGANWYDLEWTYIDSTAIVNYGNQNGGNRIFQDNASRVTLTGNSYRIPLIYDNTGRLFFRVRPVQIRSNGTVINGKWSSVDTTANAYGNYQFGGHERLLNWQATTSFAEDGKRKTVVQYYDGSLRGRQTVTKDNTSNTTIVSETYYDYQGRPAIQVMPAPTLSNIIHYTQNFNVTLNSAEYDKSDYDSVTSAVSCGLSAPPMGTSSGAAQYYSPANPEKSIGFNKYIPDAHGYAFTETEYTPDNTGRISRQGGVGETHQLGSGHETKYSYGIPSPESLNALFGTDAGVAQHYFKNMVRDANGQYSVSYVDMHGRTVATALAGNPPKGADALNSFDTMPKQEAFADSGSAIVKGLVIEHDNTINVTFGGDHRLRYDLNTDTLLKPDCSTANIPYSCLYDLNISIIGDCNNANLPGGKAFSYTISNYTIDANGAVIPKPGGIHVDTTIRLPEGNYDVSKQLSVSQYALAYWRDSVFMKYNHCRSQKTIIDSISAVLHSLTTDCKPTCQTCMDSLGSWSSFKTSYFYHNFGTLPSNSDTSAAWTSYQNALANCNKLCGVVNDVVDYRQSVLKDMSSPTGQYANPDSSADKYSIYHYSSIVHNANGNDDTSYVFQTPSIVYLDANGKPDMVFDDVTKTMVTPNKLDSAQFAAKFKESWAAALLPYHPEYCKLIQYESFKSSMLWDRKLEKIDDYYTAVHSGYFNPIEGSGGITSNIDPLNASYHSQLNDSLNKHYLKPGEQNSVFSLWTLACASVKCVTNSSNSQDTSCLHTFRVSPFDSSLMCPGDQDMAWRSFKTMYLQVKNNIYSNAISSSCNNTSSLLLKANHVLVFNTASSMLTNNGMGSYSSDTAGKTKANDTATAKTNATLDANCQGWVKTWKQQLASCPQYSQSDIDSIIPRLLQVCRKGADADHWYGARSIKPGTDPVGTYGSYDNFDDVINWANGKKTVAGNDVLHCNADIITAPAPYNKTDIYSNVEVWTKPDSCQCSSITAFHKQYLSEPYGLDASFSAYMLRTQHTTISDADLNNLLNMCNGTYTCYLQKPITIPPVFQCNAGTVCATCDDVSSKYQQFKFTYPGVVPTLEANNPTTGLFDSVQQNKNLLFSSFMNNHLGFSYNSATYLNFMTECENFTGANKGAGSYPKFQTSFEVNDSTSWPTDDPNQNDDALNSKHVLDSVFNGDLWTFKHAIADYDYSFDGHYRLQLDANSHYDAFAILPPLYNANYIRFYAKKDWSSDSSIPIKIDYTLDGSSWVALGSDTIQDDASYHLVQINNAIPNGARIRIFFAKYSEQNNQCALEIDSLSSDGTTKPPFFQTSFEVDANNPWPTYDPYFRCQDSIGFSKLTANNTPVHDTAIDGKIWSFKHAFAEYSKIHSHNGHYRLRLDNDVYYDAFVTLPAIYHANSLKFYTKQATSFGYANNLKIDYTVDGTSWTSMGMVTVSDDTAYHLVQINSAIPDGARVRFLLAKHPKGKSYSGLVIDDVSTPDGSLQSEDYNCNEVIAANYQPESLNVCGHSSTHPFYSDSGTIIYDSVAALTGHVINASNAFWRSDSTTTNGPLNRCGAWVCDSCDTAGCKPYNKWIGFSKKVFFPATSTYYIGMGGDNNIRVKVDGTIFKEILQTNGYPMHPFIYWHVYPMTLTQGWHNIGVEGKNADLLATMGLEIYHNTPTQIASAHSYAELDTIVTTLGMNQTQFAAGYSCPIGYTLNATNHTCSRPVSCRDSYAGPRLCGKSDPLIPTVPADTTDNCTSIASTAIVTGTDVYTIYTDSVRGSFEADYILKCMQAYRKEHFVHSYTGGEYHYTLYCYDQAGNLVKTVPPAGVVPVTRSTWSDSVNVARKAGLNLVNNQHRLATVYRYNSLNQVVAQYTPDAGCSKFWYDRLGRLCLSQNAKQATTSKYSYTLYDSLGRITEVGQLTNATQAMDDSISRREDRLLAWITSANASREQITRTVYDKQYTPINITLDAKNLRNRVAYTAFYNTYADLDTGGRASATYYSYDIHGNVDTLLQDYKGIAKMTAHGNRFKKMVYQYDLISGKVNSVAYQPNSADAFYHSYLYDAENRLTNVLTSHDSINWDNDAYYQYYKHGPLARTITGQLQVQGTTNVYTLQGCIKAVNPTVALFGGTSGNGIDNSNSPCGSGTAVDSLLVNARLAPNPNQYVARKEITLLPGFQTGTNDSLLAFIDNTLSVCYSDNTGNGPIIGNSFTPSGNGGGDANDWLVARNAYGYALNYYSDTLHTDYAGIAATPSCQLIPGQLGNGFHSLYNGNIAAMGVNIPSLASHSPSGDGGGDGGMVYSYKYDQLNRLTAMDAYTASGNFTNVTATDNYRERIGYDANGNILRYFRNGYASASSSLNMDNLTYRYKIGNNQLDYINDAVPATNYSTDLDNQDTLNYTYDKIGSMVSDRAKGIDAILWTVYGKVDSVHKTNGIGIKYLYDASGSRIYKAIHSGTNNAYTVYVKDASGNVMSIYTASDSTNSGHLTQEEAHIYGSGKLGIFYPETDMDANNFPPDPSGYMTGFKRGNKRYHFTEQRGNVMLELSDRKIPVSLGGTTIDHYEADVVSANDYSSFGRPLSGRTYNGQAMRYTFNGKEADPETGWQDYGFRVLDDDGRFISVDPLTKKYPELTPYQFASNRPIDGIDLDGLEFSKYWTRSDVEARAQYLMTHPIEINQRGAGTCTIAAVTYLLILHDKQAFHTAVMGLYDRGEAYLYDWIRPNKKLQNTDPAATPDLSHKNYKKESADWIFLSSVQDSQNSFLDFTGTTHEGNAEGNYRSDLKNLMHNVAMFNDVKQEYFNSSSDIKTEKVLNDLQKRYDEGYGIVLEIDAKLIPAYGKGNPNEVEGHNVAYIGGLKITRSSNNTPTMYSFDVQSWGDKQTITCDENTFKKYYKGSTYGK